MTRGKKVDLIGKKFGKWTVLERTKYPKCRCVCECGDIKEVFIGNLINGGSLSCRNCHSQQHGETNTRLYRTWLAMRRRCDWSKMKGYHNYGGRGIKVCDEWHKFMDFKTWSESNGYKEDLTLDRINVNGNYEPSNCRWVTMKIQNNNKQYHNLVTVNGVTKSVTEWAEETGISRHTLYSRVSKGWTESDLLLPKQKGNQYKKTGLSR